MGSILGNWIQFFSFIFEASPSLAWQNLFYSWIGFIAPSSLFDIYSVNFMLGYMRHVATRIPKRLYCKSEALAFKEDCLCSKFQNLILEPKAEKSFGTVFGALRWTNELEAIKFFWFTVGKEKAVGIYINDEKKFLINIFKVFTTWNIFFKQYYISKCLWMLCTFCKH